jgi:hypothetical protein
MKGMRGAVVVETALTVGIGLTILLFSIQVGALGFLQVTADAASFTAAHSSALGSLPSASPAALVHNTFPQIATADVTIPASPSPAPTATLLEEYEYNNPAEYNLNGVRHAGESMLQPLQVQTKIVPHGKVSLLGQLIGVGAQDVEAEWVECTPHFNAANTPYAQCGATSNPAGYSVNYFTNGENTPPYYIGFNFMQQCPKAMPWTSCTVTPNFLSLGIGAFLDTYNWGVTTPGVNGANQYWSGSGGPGVAPSESFEFMECHFDRWADLAFFFQHFADLPELYSGSSTEGVGGWGTTINNWLATNPTSFKTMNSFYSATVDPGVDNDIQQIYNWDVTLPKSTAINSQEPGTNSSYTPNPGGQC